MGIRKAAHIVGLAAASLVLAVSPALASHRKGYVNGLYMGTVKQSTPNAYAGAIGFTIHGHTLTQLRFSVTMVCAGQLITKVDSPPTGLTAKVGEGGRFAYAGSFSGAQVKLHGVVQGHRAKGTLFESIPMGPGVQCTMQSAAPFGTGVRVLPPSSTAPATSTGLLAAGLTPAPATVAVLPLPTATGA
jgi:hypothetical protein